MYLTLYPSILYEEEKSERMGDRMLHSEETILAEIDATLDQLIQNAVSVRGISLHSLHTNEVDALRKTQESLLARLVHMNKLLGEEQQKKQARKKSPGTPEIDQKMAECGRLNRELMDKVSQRFKNKRAQPKKIHLPRNRRKGSIL